MKHILSVHPKKKNMNDKPIAFRCIITSKQLRFIASTRFLYVSVVMDFFPLKVVVYFVVNLLILDPLHMHLRNSNNITTYLISPTSKSN